MIIQPKIEVVDANHCMATWKNVFILIWRQQTTMEGIATLRQRFDQFAATAKPGAELLTIVEEDAPMPSSEARDALAKFLAGASGRVRYSAVVHEGSGFRAAAVRGVVTGLTLIARMPYPHKIFSTVADAARWFDQSEATAGEITLRASEIIFAVSDVRAKIKTGH